MCGAYVMDTMAGVLLPFVLSNAETSCFVGFARIPHASPAKVGLLVIGSCLLHGAQIGSHLKGGHVSG